MKSQKLSHRHNFYWCFGLLGGGVSGGICIVVCQAGLELTMSSRLALNLLFSSPRLTAGITAVSHHADSKTF